MASAKVGSPMTSCHAVHGELAGDQRRAAAVAVLDDLHQVAPLAGGEPVRAPVVEDQQIGAGERAEQPAKRPSPCASSRSAKSRGTRA